METIYGRFEDISFDAGPIESRERKRIMFLNPDIISKIEHQLEVYEKVSLSFLFFDEIHICLNICEKCLSICNYNFMSENSIDKYANWSEKFVECIFYIKHFLLLRELGVSKYDAQRLFKVSKFVSKQRLLLFQICENLTNAESFKLMESIPSISPEKYLEVFILKILSSNDDLQSFIQSLFLLNIPVINSFLEDLMKCPLATKINITRFQPLDHLTARSKKRNEDDVYMIKDPNNVGLCLIINEVTFENQQQREGSSKDVSELTSTMEYFNFEVKTFTDVPKKFFDDLNFIIETNFKDNYSVFFMIIMSHGLPGAIYCSDEKSVQIDFITKKLCCKSLQKIPKVLIVQACQGEHFLVEGLTTDGPTSLDCDQVPDQKSLVKVGSNISDFILAKSTVIGFKAFRDTNKGSWFIQAFCNCLKENENESISRILTKTIKQVKDNSYLKKNKYRFIQQPVIETLLDKELYLKPIF